MTVMIKYLIDGHNGRRRRKQLILTDTQLRTKSETNTFFRTERHPLIGGLERGGREREREREKEKERERALKNFNSS